MKLYKHFSLVLIFLLSFDSFGQKNKKTIFFYEIDDQVAVYVDGKKVYESDIVGQLPGEVEIEVDVTKYIKNGDEEVTVELFNVVCNCATANPWAITFEIRDGDEELDFQNEKGEGDAGKTPVFVYSFTWNELL